MGWPVCIVGVRSPAYSQPTSALPADSSSAAAAVLPGAGAVNVAVPGKAVVKVAGSRAAMHGASSEICISVSLPTTGEAASSETSTGSNVPSKTLPGARCQRRAGEDRGLGVEDHAVRPLPGWRACQWR